VILDNSAPDLDARSGVYDIDVGQAGTYHVCIYSAGPSRTFPPDSKCVTKSVGGNVTDFGSCKVTYFFSMYWWASVNGIPTSKGTYTVAGPNGFFATVVNNDQNDLSKSATVYVKVPTQGAYTVCQTVPPA
jgi:hypothetical protein